MKKKNSAKETPLLFAKKAKGLIRPCVCVHVLQKKEIKLHAAHEWQTYDCRLSIGTARRQHRMAYENMIVKISYQNYERRIARNVRDLAISHLICGSVHMANRRCQ